MQALFLLLRQSTIGWVVYTTLLAIIAGPLVVYWGYQQGDLPVVLYTIGAGSIGALAYAVYYLIQLIETSSRGS